MKTMEHAAFIALTKEQIQQMFPNGFTVIDQKDFEELVVNHENLEAELDKFRSGQPKDLVDAPCGPLKEKIAELEAQIETLEYIFNSERRDAWVKAWTAVARAEGCRDKKVPAYWADQMLSDYDERFKR